MDWRQNSHLNPFILFYCQGPELCEAGKFQCKSDKTCIDIGFRCDGKRDCDDQSDEIGCRELSSIFQLGEANRFVSTSLA